MGTDGDVHRVIVLLDFFYGHVLADGHGGADGDAGGENVGDIPVQHILGQAVVGNAVAQHAAQLGALLIHGDLVAHEGQVVGRGQTAGAAADDGHPLPSVSRPGGRGQIGGVVHGVALESADVHAVIHHPPPTLGLAGVLAHIGAHGGEGVIFTDEAHRVLVPPLPDQGHIAWNVHVGGAGGHAGHRVA